MSFLTDAEKAAIFADFHAAMDTYCRPLTVYQEAQRTVVSSNPNWNPIEAFNQNDLTVTNTPVYATVSGRIMWDRSQDWNFVKGLSDSQLKVKSATDRACRIKVDYSGYSLLKTAKKVEVDGVMLTPESEPRPHGPFGTGYWTFYFIRSA